MEAENVIVYEELTIGLVNEVSNARYICLHSHGDRRESRRIENEKSPTLWKPFTHVPRYMNSVQYQLPEGTALIPQRGMERELILEAIAYKQRIFA